MIRRTSIIFCAVLLLLGSESCRQNDRLLIYEDVHMALKRGDEKTFVELVARIPDINGTCEPHDLTPLVAASKYGRYEAVETLVRMGADVNRLCGHQHDTPLIDACQNDHLQVVKFLVQTGADVNKKSIWEYTALMAAASGEQEIAAYLVEHGADVNAKETALGYTPLFDACWHSKLSIARLLIERGADVNAKDNAKRTPLMAACLMDNVEMVSLLLAHGANKESVSADGKTAQDIAESKGRKDIVELLNRK